MNKEFVTYEQALALKKLGFDEPVIGFYNHNNPHYECGYFHLSTEHMFSDDITTTKQSEFCVSAPTYSQAFRFFRDNHNLCGEVYTVNMGAIDYTFQIRDLYSEDVKHNNFEAYAGGYVGTFLNYEEAEHACLEKLIEICKNK